MRFVPEKKSLLGESLESFESEILAADFPKYRAKQVLDWIFKKRISDWDSMKNLPKALYLKLTDKKISISNVLIFQKAELGLFVTQIKRKFLALIKSLGMFF